MDFYKNSKSKMFFVEVQYDIFKSPKNISWNLPSKITLDLISVKMLQFGHADDDPNVREPSLMLLPIVSPAWPWILTGVTS